MREKKINKQGIFLMIIIPLFCELFFLMVEGQISFASFFYDYYFILKSINLARMVFLYSLSFIIMGLFNYLGKDKLILLLFKYRYLWGMVFLILMVALEIHASSIHSWQNYLAGSDPTIKPLIGQARDIRSDEWAVNTPMMISQYLNHSGIFPYFSQTIRGALTDTFIIYGQPVLDIAVIFRPFHWGYLFLSPARGLAFFWMSRLMLLFLISFEFGRVLTEDRRILALSYAILLTFAPIVQWWFAINGLVEMLIFGQGGIVLINLYMKTADYRLRALIAFVLTIIGGGFILTFYPAWQVVLAYVFGVLSIAVLFEKVKKSHWKRWDLIILASALLLLAVGLFYVFSKSAATIELVMNTAYPGNSQETGGGQSSRFFLAPGNFFFPLATDVAYANVSELSVFFDFFPMGILMAWWVLIKEKKKDPFLIGLLILSTILILWCIFPWPWWLAKISLLSFSKPERAFLAVGFLNLLLLFRALALIETGLPQRWLKAVVALGLSSIIVTGSVSVYQGYLNVKLGLISFILMTISFLILLNGHREGAKKALVTLSLVVAFFSGAFVNPLVAGLDVIEKAKIIGEIKEITATDQGLWIYESGDQIGFPFNNLPLMGGAPTINSTNVYPNLNRWHLLDPDGSEEEIYNRYAHVGLGIVPGKETFVLESPDLFRVNLELADLKTLQVDYILTRRDLSVFSGNEIIFKELANQNGLRIYQTQY